MSFTKLNFERISEIIFSIVLSSLLSVSLMGCKSDNDDFAFAEETTGNNEPVAVEIISYTPNTVPVRVTDSSSTTFVVSVNSGAGDNVTYTWKLDGTTLATGSDSFYAFDGTLAPSGSSSLVVTADNQISTDTHAFNLDKNAVPTIDSSVPAAAGNMVNCDGSTIQFSITASDPDADALTYTWKLNGIVHATYYSITNGAGTSINDFTPPCTLAGANTVTVDVNDGYDTASTAWAVSVLNPTLAQIISYLPLSNPVIIPSTSSENFSMSATGKNPLAYEWRLNGTAIPGETSSFLTLNAASVPVGLHVLTAAVSDFDSNDTQDINVKRNAPPVLSNEFPTAATSQLNYQSFLTFSIDGADANSDAITYTWTLDGVPSVFLADSATAGGSQAIFSPDVTLIGSHTVMVTANDGTETDTHSWVVEVNYFSNACNQLTAGQICTAVGAPGLGSGVNPTTNEQVAKMMPEHVTTDGNGNLIISDVQNDVIWFHNRSGADVNIIGTTVPAGEIKVIAGSGAQGIGTVGLQARRYHLYEPYSAAYDPVRGDLYVALYSRYRVVRFTSTGLARHDICSGSTANSTAVHTNGNPATSHACRRPTQIALDSVNRRLFVSNYDHHNVKYFDITDADPANWTGFIVAGRQNGAGAFGLGTNDGTTGGGSAGTVGRIRNPWGLNVDSNGIVYFTTLTNCYLWAANITGSNTSYYGGAVTLNSGQMKRIGGSNTCNSLTGNYNSLRIRNSRGVAVLENAGIVRGFFVSMEDQDRITFINNTAAAITIGNTTVNSYQGDYVWGTGNDGYNGDSPPANTSYLFYPRGLSMDSTGNATLYVADRNNYRLRSLDVSVSNGNLASVVSGKEPADFNGGSNTPAPDVVMNNPTNIIFDAANSQMLFSDASNGRVRSVNIVTGAENSVVGAGPGNGDIDQEDPGDVYMRGPRGISLYNNSIIFADKYESTGVSRNCLIRAYNKNATTTDFFNTFINPSKVSTIAGDHALGCNIWQGAYEGGAANNMRIYRPEGVVNDGTNLYFANHLASCINKVAPDGTLTTFIGDCTNAVEGNVDGPTFSDASTRLRRPATMIIDPAYVADGNMFIADQTNQLIGRIKYVNRSASSVTIAGVSVPANNIRTVFTNSGYGYGVAAYQDMVCYTSGYVGRADLGQHNVICKDRTDPLGNITMRAGPSDGSTDKGYSQEHTEEEGVAASSASLYIPYDIAFDSNGDLWISERGRHVIRKVKKWW